MASGEGEEDYSTTSFSTIRRVIQSNETKAIISYVRQNPNTTIDKVARQLQEQKVCSRLTTLSMIRMLMTIGLIKDDRRGKYFHSLSVNEDFDFNVLASRLFKSDVKENLKIFDKFVFQFYPDRAHVKELHDYLDEAIREYYTAIGYPLSASDRKQAELNKKKGKQHQRRKI